MPHLLIILFLFALGACIGSFLNVVVWRLPRDESLVTPPSHCPKCGKQLKWYDNIPVFGWIKLRGKCRFCGQPISARYPIVEAFTGGLFVFYYVMFFMVGFGPCLKPGMPVMYASPMELSVGWPTYALYMLLICVLLAASLIDAEHFFIPIQMIWYVIAPIALAWHAFVDTPRLPGALNASPVTAALAVGGGIGVIVSYALWQLGKIPTSFADGGPALEIEKAALERERKAAAASGTEAVESESPLPQYTKKQIRAEIRKEVLFLLPPMAGAALAVILLAYIAPLRETWTGWIESHHWLSGLLGSLFGLLIGGFVVWATRILGTLGFGREAMGMGDVHLMAGVGAVVGAGAATVAFFIAPFFGIALAVYMLLTGTRRELPYGPYLSLATAAVMLFYCEIAAYLAPGMEGVRLLVGGLFGQEG